MLEGLDTIDWKSRNAERVPAWIRGLASDDRQTRIQAFNDFETHVVFGDRSFEEVDFMWGLSDIFQTDVPILTVPFLIELLNSDRVQDKVKIVYFLHRMALYIEFHYEGDLYVERAREVRSAIWDGFDTYLKLLNHPDPKVRMETIGLLTQYGEYGQQVFTHIIQRLKIEAHVKTIVIALWNLSYNLVQSIQLPSVVLGEYKDLLQSFLSPRYEDPVRVVAAVFFIEHFGNTALPETVDVVREVVGRNLDRKAEPFDYLSISSGLYPFWSKVSAILGTTT